MFAITVCMAARLRVTTGRARETVRCLHTYVERPAVLIRIVIGVLIVMPPAASAAGLPDGRVYEQVSPPLEKDGSDAGVRSIGGVTSSEPLYAIASSSGEPGLLYGDLGTIGSTSGEFAVSQLSAAGWTSRAAIPRAIGIQTLTNLPETVVPSSNLESVFFDAAGSYIQGDPYTANGSSGSFYISSNEPAAPEHLHIEWVSEPKPNYTPYPELGDIDALGGLALVGEAPDLSTVYFGYYGTLVPEDASRASILKSIVGTNAFTEDWGLYEWRAGSDGHAATLANAGELPNGTFDSYGAMPAATEMIAQTALPEDFDNQVSTTGSRMFFVSPNPAVCRKLETSFCGGETPELYVRETTRHGTEVTSTTSLVSRDDFPHPPTSGPAIPAPGGPRSFANANFSGAESRVFASPDGSHAFFTSEEQLAENAPTSGIKWYDYDVTTGALTYLSQIEGAPVVSSSDGARLIFLDTATKPNELDLWSSGTTPAEGTVTRLASFEPGMTFVGPARLTDEEHILVFRATALKAPGSAAFNDGGGYQQIYRMDLTAPEPANSLTCISCPPASVTPSGDATLSNDDTHASSGPPLDNHGTSADGTRVFFDSPDALVSQAVNGRRNVYEWENGHISLISGAAGPFDSYFLDNTPSGDDVFFATAEDLVPGDTDEEYDVYDARVGGTPPASPVLPTCSEEQCQGAAGELPAFGTPTSMAFVGAGNIPPSVAATSSAPHAKTKRPSKAKRKTKPRKKARKTKRRKARKNVKGARA